MAERGGSAAGADGAAAGVKGAAAEAGAAADRAVADLTAAVEGWAPPVLDAVDPMGAGPSAALAATLGRPAPAGFLPPLWHWVHFVEWAPASALGPDGHPAGGGLYPAIPERTRMFVGGRLELRGPLTVGKPAHRRSAVTGHRVTVGRTGPMLLVSVRNEISQEGEVVVVDEQDLMYRSGRGGGGAGPSGAPRPPAGAGPTGMATGSAATGSAATDAAAADVSADPWRASVPTDPVTLFRFSALTGNSHRIHYDHPYVTGEEGYPGLVVHGPLLALSMLTLAADRGDRPIGSVTYRLQRPVFSGDTAEVAGGPVGDGAELRVLVRRAESVAGAGGTEGGPAPAEVAARADVRWA